ncbi:type VI secretion system-associated protein TagF [Noviherbaspirillum sp.]|uniref:type VI secretion system-associated protein TagF n=1 Tax=Noviherbaspirillum sp. TaxID=1926288 RepID=UPI002FDF1F3E
MTHPETSPGFFGKVTTHGDFVSRRLPTAFLSVWDSWLQYSVQQSRETLGQEWLNIYLSSPIWRFALAPGVCGVSGWAGILMPSVDRVGRHFPLTIAAALPDDRALVDWIQGSKGWYDEIEGLALSSLDSSFSLQGFDLQLAGLAIAPSLTGFAPRSQQGLSSSPRRPQGSCVPITDITQAGAAAAEFQENTGLASFHQYSMWWTDGSPRVDPCFLAGPNLPLHASFAAMLDGEWAQHGWAVGLVSA